MWTEEPQNLTTAAVVYDREVTTLVRGEQPHNDLEGLRARVTGLEQALRDRRAEVSATRAGLDAFRIRYRHAVGRLHEELDRLELELAEVELGIISERVGEGAEIPADHASTDRIEVPPKYTTDAIRKLFRDVAKAVHPDLAGDEAARDRRHALMIEANRAYALGDEEQLRAILSAWERSPEAVIGTDPDAMRLRLLRRIDQIQEELSALAIDLSTLTESSLWQLKAMVDDEAAKGTDLIEDMVRRLNRDILVATNRLEALRDH